MVQATSIAAGLPTGASLRARVYDQAMRNASDPTPPWPRPPHLSTAAQAAEHLRVDLNQGLALDEVETRRAQHGLNRLADAQPRTWASRLLSPFKDFMILVLLAAAGLSGWMGDLTDTVIIVVIVVLNAAISITQEWQADQAMAALKRMVSPQARVRRGGHEAHVDTAHLVPGDVVLLEAGNQVPADLRLHEVAQLRVDESALTGESLTVEKHPDHLPDGDHALGDQVNMAFKGTLVTHGRAEGLVVATGPHTQLGQVARLLQDTDDRTTPLQRRLAAFGKRLSLVVLAICAIVFTLGVLRGEAPVLMVLTALSLAVAAIPEALPAVVTVLLALGARRLVAVNALVRRLPSVETLGSVTVICSDKTGTLTLNRMQVQSHDTLGGPLAPLQTACLLCNDAQRMEDGTWVGDPTETALADWAWQAGLDPQVMNERLPRQREWPFDSDRKRMSTLHGRDSGWIAFTKGAPESVLPRCTLQWGAQGPVPLDATQVLALAQGLAAQGMRVMAVAQQEGHGAHPDLGADAFEQGLTLLGLVALIDPPRPEAAAAVAECLAAGIRPVMITGDHPATALAIAQQLGITPPGMDATRAVITGSALAQLDDAALAERVVHVSVYARMDPAQKIRVVQALQSQGHFVAMTGDGVNDAPALKAADIGVAMGRGGTDVAREAASLVLLDDNFATIVGAVREGRRIFDNIRKFIRYAMTGNSGEVWVLFLAPLVGLPLPLLPIHILWVNLVTDGLPGLALAAEPAEPGVMKRPPRAPQESIFAHGLWQHTLWVGLLIAGLCLGVQAWAQSTGRATGQTLVFMVLTLSQMAHLLAIRSESVPLWRLGWGSNRPLWVAVAVSVLLQVATVQVPALREWFHTVPLSALEWWLCVGCAAVVYCAVEVEKAWRR